MSRKAEKAKRGLEKAQAALDLPEGLMSSCLIEMTSNREAVLGGPVTVLEYDEHAVLLELGGKKIKFSGERISISCLTADGVKICGEIEKMEFVRAG